LLIFEDQKAYLEVWVVTKAKRERVFVVPPIHVVLEERLECKITPGVAPIETDT
jgi:hypothetical protein